MSTEKKQIKAYVDDDTKAKFKYIAELDKRSESNLMEILAIKHIEEYESKHGKLIIHENGKVKPSINNLNSKSGKSSNSKIG